MMERTRKTFSDIERYLASRIVRGPVETNLLSSVRSAGQWLYSDITSKEWITETAAQVVTLRSNPTSETLQLFCANSGPI